MTTIHDIPAPRTPTSAARGSGFTPFTLDDGAVIAYAPGSFIALASLDGHVNHYALTARTRLDAARLNGGSGSVRLGDTVNLTARVENGTATATTIRLHHQH